MNDQSATGPRPDPGRRDELAGLAYFLGEVGRLRERGLIPDESYRTIVNEYSARRDALEQLGRFDEALVNARRLAVIDPRQACHWAEVAREAAPERPEGWFTGVALLRKVGRFDEADRLAEEAARRLPGLAEGLAAPKTTPKPMPARFAPAIAPEPRPSAPKVSWSTVAGAFLEDHWQKLISGLAALLIVVSSTVGASLVLGPLLWSPAGKVVLALAFTAACAGFGLGLTRWGAGWAGRVMLATSLVVVPIDLMLLGELGLVRGGLAFDVGLAAVDLALLLALARWVVGALGIGPAGRFSAAFFALAAFNAGASPGMPAGAGLAVFVLPGVVFLGAVAWLGRRVVVKGWSGPAGLAYLEFGLLAFAFLSGVARTGAAVLHLASPFYAVPAMLAAIAGVTTARAVGSFEKDRRVILSLQQGGLALSALAFALALARPPGPSPLTSGNTLAVALLGLALYASNLRATRQPAYLYGGFAALVVAYFGSIYFASDLVRSVEESARRALGYDHKLPWPFKAINGLAFNLGLGWLSTFFARKWSDPRLARHCHWIGLPVSVLACVLSGFEPKAAVICLGGYALLYALASRAFAEPRLVYLACAAAAGASFFGASAAGRGTLEIRSLLASGLGLVFWAIRATPWLVRAGESYRVPLIRSARVMAGLAMAAATLGAIGAGWVAPTSAVAFLLVATLALLNGRESPRAPLYLLAVSALLGAWLGGFHGLHGLPASPEAHGLAVVVFAVGLILAGEAAGRWLGEAPGTEAYSEAIGWAVPVLVLAGWGLAGWAGVDSVTVARTLLVGSVAWLWLTRFRREVVLVYLGIAGLAGWAGCLCGLVVPGGDPARLAVWLAILSAACSLAAWGVGEWVRRRGDSFYESPCFHMAVALAVGAGVLAVDGRWISADSYRVGVAAMLAGSASLGLVAWSRRWPAASALAVGGVVGASYLALLSQGPTSPDRAWILGFVAAVESIACRGAGALVRKASRDPHATTARPVDFWALALILGAIPLGLDSPATLLAVALASLLMTGAFPSAAWLYGTSLVVGAAVDVGWLAGVRGDGLIPALVLGAFAALGLALGLRRAGPRLLGRLGLPDLGLHRPMARVAMILGVLAGLIRLDAIANGAAWSAVAWLPWALAGLCLLGMRLDPRRGWAHLAVGLTGIGAFAVLAPWVEPGGWWLSTLAGLALAWWLAAWASRRAGAADPGVLGDWSFGAFGLAALGTLPVVLRATFGWSPVASWAWWDVTLAIGLGAVYVTLEGQRLGRDLLPIGLESSGVLTAWWLGAVDSPLVVRSGLDRDAWLAIVTATSALVVVLIGRRIEWRPSGGLVDVSDGVGPPPRRELMGFTRWAGFGLALASVYLGAWPGEEVTLGTYVLACAALGLLGLGAKRVESAVAGGVVWCLAWPLGLIVASGWLGRPLDAGRDSAEAVGLVVALYGLWLAAGWARARGEGKADPGRVPAALEWVAIGATVPAAFLAFFGDQVSAGVGSGVLIALVGFFALVAWRRGAEWPAYGAQALVLACYFRIRPALGLSGGSDAVVLAALAYVDLGLAELIGRLGRSPFARPTLRFALTLPLVPLVQAGWQGRLDGVGLFVLLATSAFYALAGLRLRSRAPVYAATVLFNAALWLGWSLLGWRLAESPQFYLIPVGFTMILFAEANREELGRGGVNALRSLGLILAYASLAAPIWEAQSFGAWLALLILSLVGVFAGIGQRVQSFLWLGLVGFVLDLGYQLGRIGVDHPMARWAVMLALGVGLILFVALNEKKAIVSTLRTYYDEARGWE